MSDPKPPPLNVNVVLNDEKQAILVSMTPWPIPYPTVLTFESASDNLYIWGQCGRAIAIGPYSASIGLMQCEDFFLGEIVGDRIVTVAEVTCRWRADRMKSNSPPERATR